MGASLPCRVTAGDPPASGPTCALLTRAEVSRPIVIVGDREVIAHARAMRSLPFEVPPYEGRDSAPAVSLSHVPVAKNVVPADWTRPMRPTYWRCSTSRSTAACAASSTPWSPRRCEERAERRRHCLHRPYRIPRRTHRYSPCRDAPGWWRIARGPRDDTPLPFRRACAINRERLEPSFA